VIKRHDPEFNEPVSAFIVGLDRRREKSRSKEILNFKN
jgi:hypothetical protein